jgi:hypothetical protein
MSTIAPVVLQSEVVDRICRTTRRQTTATKQPWEEEEKRTGRDKRRDEAEDEVLGGETESESDGNGNGNGGGKGNNGDGV